MDEVPAWIASCIGDRACIVAEPDVWDQFEAGSVVLSSEGSDGAGWGDPLVPSTVGSMVVHVELPLAPPLVVRAEDTSSGELRSAYAQTLTFQTFSHIWLDTLW